MMNLIRGFIQQVLNENLLLELRDLPETKIPHSKAYFAKLFANGWIAYFDDENGKPGKPTKDSIMNLVSKKDFECTPEELAKIKQYVKFGFVKEIPEKLSYPDITFNYLKKTPGSPAANMRSPDDLPLEYMQYSIAYSRNNPMVKVDTESKLIDMDVSWTGGMTRRPGGSPSGSNRKVSYVIPSGDVAFENRYADFQKLLKHLLQQDSRVTPDFHIAGEEKYRGKTIADVLKLPREMDIALSGRAGKGALELTAYHGTSARRWEQIKKSGLRPNKQGVEYVDQIAGWSSENIYLTFSPAVAENYATRQAIWDGTKTAMVLKVTIPDPAKIVADEDALGEYYFTPSREYTITFAKTPFEETYEGKSKAYKYDPERAEERRRKKEEYDAIPPETFVFRKDTQQHVKNVLRMFSKDARQPVVKDAESEGLFNDAWKHMQKMTKNSLKAGTFAYRGNILPNFVKPFMSYPLTKFKTIENDRKRRFLGFDEYQETRKKTQGQAKRYD